MESGTGVFCERMGLANITSQNAFLLLCSGGDTSIRFRIDIFLNYGWKYLTVVHLTNMWIATDCKEQIFIHFIIIEHMNGISDNLFMKTSLFLIAKRYQYIFGDVRPIKMM